jgi:hypothetical protein
MITITEVLRRADQGRTEPFVCRADDGHTYYVKGRHAGYRSLCCEWVAGRLARAAGLSVPEFTMAHVPLALVEQSERADIGQLGHGQVFASLQVDGAREMTWQDTQNLDDRVLNQVLFFDLWVQNEDRTLSALGGNPNLLIAHGNEMRTGSVRECLNPQLWVIDFNLAFDTAFARSTILEHHVFADRLLRQGWMPGFLEEMRVALSALLANVPLYFSELPQEWLYLDGDDSLPVHLDLDQITHTLSLPLREPEAFWTLT